MIKEKVLGIIPARAGSMAVPGKNVRLLAGKPVISYTIEAALQAKLLSKVVVSSDDPRAWQAARQAGVACIERPAELADNKARIDDAMRHACRELQQKEGYVPDIVVLLYANIPVRAEGIIDKVIEHLVKTGADSVQTLAPVGKFHPYWLYKLDGDRASKYIDNEVYQRQDLPELYCIDGAVGAVRYEVLMRAEGNSNPHAFWGEDRRGIVQESCETVDIDNWRDFLMAEAILGNQQ